MAVRKIDADPDRPPRHVGRAAKKVGDAARDGKVVGLDRKPLRPGQRARVRKKKARVQTTFVEASEVADRANKMIDADAWHLRSIVNAKILYLFTSAEKISGCMGGRVRTLRYPRMYSWKSGLKFDFVVLVARPQWERATDDEKTQITFHGLRHVGSDTSGRLRREPHDFEGFLHEVEHFKLRAPEVKRIAEQLRLAGVE